MLWQIIAAIVSGSLLALAYPVFNLEPLAFIAFVPLFFAIRKSSAGKAFLLSYFAGIIFWSITIYWLVHVTLLGFILLILYLALYVGIFGVFFVRAPRVDAHRAGTRPAPTLNVIFIPIVWVFLEFLRSRLITGFPWALLGYSQYLNLPFIQIADIAGVWGVSFLVMMVNTAVYDCAAVIAGGYACRPEAPKGPKDLKSLRLPLRLIQGQPQRDILISVILVCLSLGYGYYKIYLPPRADRQTPVKISLIQGNIPQHQKWDEKYRDSILERYEALTKAAANDKPDLIIWPETSVPGVINEDPQLLYRISELAKDVKTPILAGSVTSTTTDIRSQEFSYCNSAVLISEEGKIVEVYDKLHLVPFGEYVPLERYFPFLRRLIGIPIGDFTAGQEYTVFKIYSCRPERSEGSLDPSAFGLRMTGQDSAPAAEFAVLICFEDIIPALSRRFVKEGTRFLVNITNDAWFMESSAPYQHAAVSVFRAVENRVPLVRAANTGLSCFIDNRGRIYDKVSVGMKDIFVVGYRTSEILIEAKGAKRKTHN